MTIPAYQLDHENHEEDFEDFYEQTMAGFATLSIDGKILRTNSRFADWIGYNPDELIGRNFSDLLSVSGKFLYETHLAPLTRKQGYFDEIALELICPNGKILAVFVNAFERKDEQGNPAFVRLTIIKGLNRQIYEQNLRDARSLAEHELLSVREDSALREQFIAVLGHDLRSPLNAISMVANLMQLSEPNEKTAEFAATIQRSATRMENLIGDVMDFARGRLGGGISVTRHLVNVEPLFIHVVDELQKQFPARQIHCQYSLSEPLNCDAARLSQLLSNLVANALTHGEKSEIVEVSAEIQGEHFHLVVKNQGDPIPPEAIERLFMPFTRHEIRPSQQGLGLGLYISAEIARAHGGQLVATSVSEETCFTFSMPLPLHDSSEV